MSDWMKLWFHLVEIQKILARRGVDRVGMPTKVGEHLFAAVDESIDALGPTLKKTRLRVELGIEP